MIFSLKRDAPSLEQGHFEGEWAILCEITRGRFSCGARYARNGKVGQAKACFEDMVESEFPPDLYSHTALLRSLVAARDLAGAEALLAAMEAGGSKDGAKPTPDLFCYNILVEGYCRALRWREAAATVDRFPRLGLSANAATYAVLVPCLIRAQHPELALALLPEMRAKGIKLDLTL